MEIPMTQILNTKEKAIERFEYYCNEIIADYRQDILDTMQELDIFDAVFYKLQSQAEFRIIINFNKGNPHISVLDSGLMTTPITIDEFKELKELYLKDLITEFLITT